ASLLRAWWGPRAAVRLTRGPEAPRLICPLHLDQRVDEVDEPPEILLGQCTPPGGHRGAAHARHDHAVEILELVLGPYRAKVGAREIGREELHSVLALRQLGPVHVLTEFGGALPLELLRRLVDVPLRREGRMAPQALRQAVVHSPTAVHGRRILALPRVRRRDDRLAGFLVLPTLRTRLQVLDDRQEIPLGHAVPGTPAAAAYA